jgi:hypothetical protein
MKDRAKRAAQGLDVLTSAYPEADGEQEMLIEFLTDLRHFEMYHSGLHVLEAVVVSSRKYQEEKDGI